MTQASTPHLIAYKLCPYVQRSVITLEEKGIDYQRTDIDLANKPDWFKALSPTGKVPLLILSEKESGKGSNKEVLFESAVICEYLDETTPGSLLPNDAKQRAQARAWIEFSTTMLNQIGKLYNAKSKEEFEQVQDILAQQFKRLNLELKNKELKKPAAYFNGEKFSLVDAAFAPVFRYFEVFEQYVEITCMQGLEAVQYWRNNLAQRPSVQKAVSEDYHQALLEFVKKREGYLAKKIRFQK
ncbi:MAG: glutathione S-transferase family protein [Oleispira sp.]|nr:glutathione S-transferase family protein [Oleispira sp.]MBL4882379.1 glutathione S-transferase family protein [Oleispira sp.]